MATFTYDLVETRRIEVEKTLKRIVGDLTVSGSEGAGVSDIPASLFGLTKILGARELIKNDNTLIVVAGPTYAGTALLGKAAATAAPANIPAGTYRCQVEGY